MVNSNRHNITICSPRVANREMLFSASIPDWDKCRCFFYHLEDIDTKAVKVHVMWKFSGDDSQILTLSAELDLTQTDPDKLNIHNWDFCDDR